MAVPEPAVVSMQRIVRPGARSSASVIASALRWTPLARSSTKLPGWETRYVSPSASHRRSSATNDSMDCRRRAGTGLARLIRYESCAMVSRTRLSARPARKSMDSWSSHARSAQRFAIFVKICIAVEPVARARNGACVVPPAIETCAPSRTSSFQTGATQVGSYALSVLALNAVLRRVSGGHGVLFCRPDRASRRRPQRSEGVGFALRDCFAALHFADFPACFLAALFAAFFAFLRIVFRMFSMERPAAPRTVHRTGLRNHVVELAAATACGLQSVVPAVDAVVVVFSVAAKARADGAAFGDGLGH